MTAIRDVWSDLPARLRRIGAALAVTVRAGDAHAYTGLAALLRLRLGAAERACVAWAAIEACEEDDRDALVAHMVSRAGTPLPAMIDMATEARLWAEDASVTERKLYAWAAAQALSPADRAALADKLRQEVAA
jgi:hypothetical protein